ncbi:MAG: copper amine oxidase [Clostridiaceae bacterium]|nr:copper amine oxidase [Clostridiaceae bacterium]
MRNLKGKSVFIALVIMVCFSSVFYCEASALTEQIFVTVKVNDKCIKMDTQPYIKDGRTYVSVRFVAEALGSKVDWVGEQNKVLISSEEKEEEVIDDSSETVTSAVYADESEVIQLVIGSNELIAYGEKKQMDVAPELVNGRTMIPIRFVSENLDCDVKWDELTYSVSIYKEGVVVPEELIENRWYTDEDLLWLARIIHVEVKGLSINGKVAVANVVLNRVKSPQFPNTVYDVIFASGQFPPVKKPGFKELVPSKECFIAAKMALNGINNVEDCLFFNNVPFKSNNITLYQRIDGEYFYRKK